MFVNIEEKQICEYRVYADNNIYCDILGQGLCQFKVNDSIILLNDVLYVPNIHSNIVHVPVLDKKGNTIEF